MVALWLATAVSACLPGRAWGETWQRLNETGDYPIDLDLDSVTPSGDGSFLATWRLGGRPSEVDPLVATYTGTIDCVREAYHLKSLTLAHPKQTSEPPVVTDFESHESINGKYRRPLTNFDLTQEYGLPVGADGLGIVLQKVCARLPNFERDRDAQIAADRARLKCDSKTPVVPPQLCSTSNGYPQMLRALYLRLAQVVPACKISIEQAGTLASSLFDEVALEECRDSAPGCGLPLMKLEVEGLGADVGRVAQGQQCSYTPWAVQRASEFLEREASVKRFRTCVDATIPKLDDRVSSADVIADGAFGACQSQLAPSLVTSDIFASTVRPSIISGVLANRQAARRPSPTKPAGPTKPPTSPI
jgi:hypothetical protein